MVDQALTPFSSPSASLLSENVFKKAEDILKAIQEIPGLKHIPVLSRFELEKDTALEACLEKNLIGTSDSERLRIHEELFGLGPIAKLIEDQNLTEILIMSPNSIWVEREGKLEAHPDCFLNRITYRLCVDRILRFAKITIDESRPCANGRWLNFRVHVVGTPIVQEHANLTLRRIRNKRWDLQELIENHWAENTVTHTLRTIIREKKNALIIGATGSGKTSVLSAILHELPKEERVLILEDTDEIPVPNKISIKMLTRPARSYDSHALEKSPEIGLTELLKEALRMRPDRIIMGEVRGSEAKDLLMAFATGHTGCWGTLHAASPKEALLRLEMLVQMGAPQWTAQTVKSLIHSSIHYILVVERGRNGKRRLSQISQIASLEEMGFCFSTIYKA